MAAAATFNLIGSFKGLSLSSGSSSSSYSSFFNGGFAGLGPQNSVSLPRKGAFQLTIEMAHKKGAGSTKNGRDSPGQRLGVKIFGDQLAKPGAIIFHPGNNVGMGKDHTIFALIDGLVKFEKYGPDRKKVSVYPREVVPENPNSYRARKREQFRLQREKKKAKKEGRTFALPEPQLVLASKVDAAEDNPVC
ncbi:unnamed protein product [Linum tenue]|uniref:Large ribosomal subunit protein bL27c n=1 Tax=Linum tenue TaxID=586396 RepID=A0AAV0NGL6_9ROSI|nr:unnamed protein product [Linum tenue]